MAGMRQAFRNANKKRKADYEATKSTRGSGTNSDTWRKEKSTVGRTKKKTLAKAWKVLQLNTKYVIGRWQAFSANNGFVVGEGGLQLLNKADTVANTLQVPMYAFNLSTLCKGYTAAGSRFWTGVPMFQLKKVTPASTNASNWYWDYVFGTKNTPQGTGSGPYWNVEETNVVQGTTKSVMHNWSDIKMVFYGAKNRKHNIKTMICTMDSDISPNRRYADDAGVNVQEYESSTGVIGSEEMAGADLFWDHFWADKVGNPIRDMKAKPKKQYLKVVSSTNTTINADSNTDLDAAPNRVVKEIFLREDRMLNVVSAIDMEAAGPTTVGTNQNPGFNDASNIEECGMFPARDKNKWLIVYSDTCFDQVVNGVWSNQYWPSFDINVRGKWSVTN